MASLAAEFVSNAIKLWIITHLTTQSAEEGLEHKEFAFQVLCEDGCCIHTGESIARCQQRRL
jgi:hypothetical protein